MAQRRRNASGGDILAEMYYLSARAALVRWPRRHECWMFSRSYFFLPTRNSNRSHILFSPTVKRSGCGATWIPFLLIVRLG